MNVGDYGLTRLPEDYYFLPISSPIQRSHCVFPCTLRTHPDLPRQNSLYPSSASDEVSGAASEQDDKVIVIHEHHHHHHHRNVTDDDDNQADTQDITYTEEEEPEDFYTQAPKPDYVESSGFYTGESRNEASESQQYYSKESMDKSLEKKKAFKNFFYKFYETLRRRAAQEKKRVRNKEIIGYNTEVYDKDMYYDDQVEGKEVSDDFDDGFKAIKVHAVEIDPFVEEGFEPILEYELK